jgi:uncharacterized protein
MKNIVLKILVFYKKYISGSGIGNHCRFVPTCSEYSYQAVDKYGVRKGLWLALKRILRCRPGGGSGIDLLK